MSVWLFICGVPECGSPAIDIHPSPDIPGSQAIEEIAAVLAVETDRSVGSITDLIIVIDPASHYLPKCEDHSGFSTSAATSSHEPRGLLRHITLGGQCRACREIGTEKTDYGYFCKTHAREAF